VIAVAGALFWRQRVHSPPKLTDRDILVVADFDNKTGDPVSMQLSNKLSRSSYSNRHF